MSDAGWKRIGGKNFRLMGISHKVPLKLKAGEKNQDPFRYRYERDVSTRNRPESYRLQKMAALARENGLYARIVPMARDKTLGRQRWGLYVRPKESYSWDNRFNGSDVVMGRVVEVERPKEWSEESIRKNKRRAGQLKNWREGRNKMWSKMKAAFDKAEKTANRGGKLMDNKEFIDSVNDYMTGDEVGYYGIMDHVGDSMRTPSRLSVRWDTSRATRLVPGNVAFRPLMSPNVDGTRGWEMPSTVGSYVYDRMMDDARNSSEKRQGA